MGTRIGTIHANVTAKDLSWSDTMRRVREETKRTADLLQGISDRGDGLGGLGGLIPTFDVGNIIGRTFGEVKRAYDELAKARENAESKADQADLVGFTMTELQGLAMGAAMANTDLNTVIAATTKFIRSLSEASAGSKEAQNDLALLGLTIKDFAGLSTADSLRLVAERLNAISNAGDRANASYSLFGKEGGKKMIAVLKGGAAALDDYIKKALEANSVLNDQEIAATRVANTLSDIAKIRLDAAMERTAVNQQSWLKSLGLERQFGAGGWTNIKTDLLEGSDKLYQGFTRLGGAIESAISKSGTMAESLKEFERVMNGPGIDASKTGDPVIGGLVPASGGLGPYSFRQLQQEVDDWDKRLADGFKIQAERMDKIIEESWKEWVGTVDNPGYLPLPGGGILDMTDQIEALKRQMEDQAKDQERSLQRQAEDLARQQMDMENATSGRGGVAAFRGSEDARRLMSASKQYQAQMAGVQRESAAERQVRDNKRMEQLTQQMLNELRSIKANQANGLQALGV